MTLRNVFVYLIFYNVLTGISVELAATAPPRGSVEFIKYAYNLRGPPEYWTSQNSFGIFNVDDKTKETIKTLVTNTFDKDLLWKGTSHRFLNHTYLNVVNVKRIENPSLFAKYNTRRKDILRSRFSGVAPEVSSLSGSRGPVATTKLLSPTMKDAIYTEVNEHYFFHGTHVNNVNSIANNGFLIKRVPAHGALFGIGIYGAETSQKADNYANSTSDVFNLLLVRITLGSIYSCTNETNRNVTVNGKLPPPGYDSVMSNFDQKKSLGVFREYIVYTEEQAYPEYIIEYTRTFSANNVADRTVVCYACILFAYVSVHFQKIVF